MDDIDYRISMLSPAQRAHLARRLRDMRADDAGVAKRLVAYVVARNGQAPDKDDLRQFLRREVPDYMVPSAFVTLDALPLMPNGKVDRLALPAPELARSGTETKAPGASDAPSDVERTLAGIWTSVLGVPNLQSQDNFFEIGGDSISGIRIVARAKSAGLSLNINQLFDHPTLGALVSVVRPASEAQKPQDQPGDEVLPASPIQSWFLEQPLQHPHQWNQAYLLQANKRLDESVLRQTIRALIERHDALRTRFFNVGDAWRTAPVPVPSVLPLTVHDFNEASAIDSLAANMNAGLNFERGELMRVALLQPAQPSDAPSALLLVLHHLIVDGVSWRVLLEELQRVYDCLASGRPIDLQPAPTSMRTWSALLRGYANSEASDAERAYWLRPHTKKISPPSLPVDFVGADALNTVAHADVLSGALSPEETRAIVYDVTRAFDVSVNEVLLTAFAEALSRWVVDTSVLVDVEGHGREFLFPGADVTQSVGWFTSVFPVWLERATLLTHTLGLTRGAMRALPNRGIGHGVLLHLSDDPEVRAALSSQPRAQVVFNYLGRTDDVAASQHWITDAAEVRAGARHPADARRYLIDLNVSLQDERLTATWTYGRRVHRRETIASLHGHFADALRGLIAAAEAASGTGSALPDTSLARLDADEMEALSSLLSGLEA